MSLSQKAVLVQLSFADGKQADFLERLFVRACLNFFRDDTFRNTQTLNPILPDLSMKNFLFFLLLLGPTAAASAAERPNVLAILVDDLGFSDLGCYGSEIETPNLDRLAANGLRFTQFYNTAKCHSSRVSLLTGRWCRQAGDEPMGRAVTIPEMLRDAGYETMMAGKWHLAKEPTDYGFNRFFGHLSGACSYFKGDKSFRLDGKPFQPPNQGFYTTTANVDYAIDFLSDARQQENRPWFLYLAFNAPHAPLHVLKEDYEKYQGRYDVGWDVIREQRFARQQKLGLFPPTTQPSNRPQAVMAWNELSPEFQDWESRRMTALAGMIDRVDQEIGRLLKDLEEHHEMENTLILFVSDNGACPYDRASVGRDKPPYDASTNWSDSTGWAWARNTPFRFFKQNQFEGGVMSPAIIHWPAGFTGTPGDVTESPAHLVDIYPTLAEVCAAPIPMKWPDREPTPLSGISLQPLFTGSSLPQRPPIHLLFASDRGLRDGDWKLVSFRGQAWELYNLADDRTEMHNLADQHPQRVTAMSARWHELTANDLQAPEREQQPVLAGPVRYENKEWTIYSSPAASTEAKRKRQRQASRQLAK